MLRAFCVLLGGLAGFFLVLLVPITAGYGISVGLNPFMVTSRPRETSGNRFLDELLFLFGYPPGSGGALLRGTLRLRYCMSRFAHKVPTWSLPVSGGVALLVSSGHGGGMLVRSDPSSPDPGRIGDKSGVPRSGLKRVRLRRKTPVHEVFRGIFLGSFSATGLEEIEAWGFICWEKMMMLEGGSCMIILILGVLFMTGRVLAKCHGVHEPTPSGLHGF